MGFEHYGANARMTCGINSSYGELLLSIDFKLVAISADIAHRRRSQMDIPSGLRSAEYVVLTETAAQ